MTPPIICPHCKNDDPEMMEQIHQYRYFCTVCSKLFIIKPESDSE